MNKKEVAELKRRLKKESCTITRMAGCYVNSSKDKVCTFNESFLNLEDEEFHKYLELASKTMSGTIGNNLVELEFPMEAEEIGAPQHALMALKASKLEDENLYNAFFDHIIDIFSRQMKLHPAIIDPGNRQQILNQIDQPDGILVYI